MVDIADIIIGKILNFLLIASKKIITYLKLLYKYVKKEIRKKQDINSKYLKFKTKIINQDQYENIRKNKNINNISPANLILYKKKQGNNNKIIKTSGFSKLKFKGERK